MRDGATSPPPRAWAPRAHLVKDSYDLRMYDPNLWGPHIAEGLQPEPRLPFGARCDIHPRRFAFNLVMATDGGDVYLCRECFLDQRSATKRHDQNDRRPQRSPELPLARAATYDLGTDQKKTNPRPR